MEDQPIYGIIILAAGNSSRLGEPKQLLRYKSKSLIRNVTESALEVPGAHVILVIGANEESVSGEVYDLPVQLARNKNWQEGMGSSVRVGMDCLLADDKQFKGVILAVSDQPHVSGSLFNELIAQSNENGNKIVACSYDETMGTPAFFPEQYFQLLSGLKGKEGARRILKTLQKEVDTLSFPLGSIDIDTREDYLNLQQDH
jgi:molybdenum cofactor cytidylyltransferase